MNGDKQMKWHRYKITLQEIAAGCADPVAVAHAALLEPPRKSRPKQPSERNQRIAKLIIEGAKIVEVARNFGISASRARKIAISLGYKNRMYSYEQANPNGGPTY